MVLLMSQFTIFNALILFSGSGKRTKGNYYLSIVFLLLGTLGLTSPTSLNSIKPELGIFLFPSSIPLNFLIGPFLYFYFRYTIQKIEFKLSSDYKHLLIFILSVINMIPFYIQPTTFKVSVYANFLIDLNSPFGMKLLFTKLSDVYLIIDVVTITYLILCLVYLLKNKDNLMNGLKNDGYQAINDWLKWLYINFTLLFLMNIIAAIRSFYLQTLPEPYYFYAISFLLFILNIKLYKYPSIMYGIKLGSNENNYSFIHRQQKVQEFEDDFSERYTDLIAEITQSREILQETYSILTMSTQLNTSPYILNKYLRIEYDINFSQLIKKLRIQLFIDSVQPSDLLKYSINGLIKLYGFKSIKQFKNDFEKYSTEEYTTFMTKLKNND